jgi:hypothetical protein
MDPINKQKAPNQVSFSRCHIGAALLLKLKLYLQDNRLSLGNIIFLEHLGTFAYIISCTKHLAIVQHCSTAFAPWCNMIGLHLY